MVAWYHCNRGGQNTMETFAMINFHYNDFSSSQELDMEFETQLKKEISADGNVNTVDVMYPAISLFLYTNPELLRQNLDPLVHNQENGFYPNEYFLHDLGSHFPNATRHIEGSDEYMPVKPSGNMLLMTVGFKIQDLYDFAGQLVNQTNLAIKGIFGLQAMSRVSRVVGQAAGAQYYSSTAASYFTQWEYFAIDPSKRHTMLSYEWRSSWELLYNTHPDKLLNLGIIPQSLYEM
ncbi:hypothetical protein B0A49_02284 [Cryomyces minteri]|uniref:Glutaminase A central domain-containing protein n=1 Tax=Cryomyces minteri TaxID=331657 RepID=A0A4V5NIV9_9PEZI|nr:hypothetical protein B0A49_02284 [Cryomyces minteri]